MTTIRNVNAVAVTVCALCTLVVSPPDSASAQEYEITLTDVRFDRVEENEDGSYFSYWVRVTATNTGSRDLDAVGGNPVRQVLRWRWCCRRRKFPGHLRRQTMASRRRTDG